MRQVRVRNTAPERRVAAAARRLGIRYRRHVEGLPARPDLVLPDHRVAVFADGCFWHGCPRCFRRPRANGAWWVKKVAANRRRDRRKDAALRQIGYSVVHIREHDSDDRVTRRLSAAVRRSRVRQRS
jgi:DNA mismatch endonuclease (patch repair protein)